MGSTSFIMHMSAALLFGGWWGALVAGVSTLLGEFARGSRPSRSCLMSLSVLSAVVWPRLPTPPSAVTFPRTYLGSATFRPEQVQRDLGVFFVFASLYFLINSASVNTAIVLTSESLLSRSLEP